MSLGDLLDIRKAQARATRERLSDSAALAAESTSSGGAAQPSRKCLFCHLQAAPYTCPTCNAPYCSVTCFRSTSHSACSVPFSEQTLKAELGAQDEDSSGAKEEERKVMMELLRKFRNGGTMEDVDNLDQDDEDEDEAGEEDQELQMVDWDKIDLDNATDEALLSLLSKGERERFEAAARDADPEQSRLRALAQAIEADERRRIQEAEQKVDDEEEEETEGAETKIKTRKDALLLRLENSLPWWLAQDAHAERAIPEQAIVELVTPLSMLLEAQSSTARTSSSSAPTLAYNIVAVLLVYTYLLQHLDLASLSSLCGSDAAPHSGPKAPESAAGLQAAHAPEENGDDDEFADMPSLEDEDAPIDYSSDSEQVTAPRTSAATSTSAKHSDAVSLELPSSRQEAERRYLSTTALEALERLLPFLFALPPVSPSKKSKIKQGGTKDGLFSAASSDLSRLVLPSVESAVHFLLSRLGTDAGMQPARSLHHLLDDVRKVWEPRRIIEEVGHGSGEGVRRFDELGDSARRRRKVLLALADLHRFLSHGKKETRRGGSAASKIGTSAPGDTGRGGGSAAAARKLLFYASHILRLSSEEEKRVADEVREERKRLEEEMERDEEQDRILATRGFEESTQVGKRDSEGQRRLVSEL